MRKWNKSVGFWCGLDQACILKGKKAQAGGGGVGKTKSLGRDR